MSDSVYGVIVAGGTGTRLWPLSRQAKPKQFMVVKDSKTLLQTTLERISPLTSQPKRWVVTTYEHTEQVKLVLGDTIGRIIGEPISRNTAPAILLTCLTIAQEEPDAIVFFVPADHVIPEHDMFLSVMRAAIIHAQNYNEIVLLGVKPTHAATGYGYIEACSGESTVQKIKSFHEKPEAQLAEYYYKQENMYWNCGIFCARVSVFLHEFKQHAPELYAHVGDFINKPEPEMYKNILNYSIDCAVLEKTNNACVIPAYFTWSDIGNLDTYLAARCVESKLPITINAYNNTVSVNGHDKLVILQDVHNLCVIDTGDVLFITERSKTEHIKNILDYLQKNGYENYL